MGGKMGGAITTALAFLLFLFMVGALGFMFGHLE
jgi:DNA-binding CsgD family transcriptional regulator